MENKRTGFLAAILRFRSIYILLVTIALSGCQKGCTTTKTVKTKSTTIKVGDAKGTVTVRHIQYKTTKAKKVSKVGEAGDRSTRFRYALVWDVDFPFWSKSDVAYEGYGEEVDLEQQLARFKIKASKDGKHFAYGVDDQLLGVMHVINDRSFEDPNYVGVEHEFVSFEKTKVDGLEDPAEVIASLLEKGELCASVDINSQDNIAEIIGGLPEDHGLSKLAFQTWPECEISKKVYTNDKLKKMINETEGFKGVVVDKLKRLVSNEKSGMFDVRDALALVIELGDQEVLDEIDAAVLVNWAGFMSSDIDEYIARRAADKKKPMNKDLVDDYVKKCEKTISNAVRGGRVFQVSMDQMVMFLIVQNRDKELNYLIKNGFSKRALDKNFSDINKAITENWDLFDDKQQKKIMKQYAEGFQYIDEAYRVDVFKFLRKNMDCKDLKDLKEKYADDLGEERLPFKCQDKT